LLPRAELEPSYKRLVWLYVFRDFSGSEADLAAERTCIRLGFTSYPQHWLVDPTSLERLKSTGRSIESFLAAAGGVTVKAGEDLAAVEAMRAAEARAAKLRKSRSVREAKAAIDEADVVLRYRALEVLAELGGLAGPLCKYLSRHDLYVEAGLAGRVGRVPGGHSSIASARKYSTRFSLGKIAGI